MTDQLLVKDKDVVVPGETLATGMTYVPAAGTYREGDNIIASKLGLASVEGKVLKIVPLADAYVPKVGDVVVGEVNDVMFSGWRISLMGPYSAVLSVKDATSDFIGRGVDLTQYFGLGDYLFCKIVNVTSQKLIDVTLRGTGLRKLQGGRLITVNPAKVPRIIGREGTMAAMIQQATKTEIVIGQNGTIWVNGEPTMEMIAVKAIQMIEDHAHKSGLTQTMKTWLEQQIGGAR
ncbi:MAG: exosome complex RNA-binding protein Rrp4 [Nanoarchaeota archaeon]|mgnify:CR=1 FL=1